MELKDIIVYCISILFFYIISNKSYIIQLISFVLITIICVYVNYVNVLKNKVNIDNDNKILYLIIDYIHVCVILFMFILIMNVIKFKCNVNYLFILNIFSFATIILFFYFKGCILSILMYNIINNKFWVNPFERIKYIIGLDKTYTDMYRDPNNKEMHTWINSQYAFFIPVLLINMYCFFKKKRC